MTCTVVFHFDGWTWRVYDQHDSLICEGLIRFRTQAQAREQGEIVRSALWKAEQA